MANTQELAQVLARKQAIVQGDAQQVAKQRAAGKLTARERVAKLLDEGSFVELDALVSKNNDYAGVVTGFGTVEDKPVYLFAQDFTVHGGAMGEKQAAKICKVLDLAMKTGAPVVALCDSAGVRVDEGAAAMNAYASIYAKMSKMSGVCPMIAVVLGPVCGGAALITQLCDITIEAEDVGALMLYGPQVVSAVKGKTVDAKKLGGAAAMAAQGGISLVAGNEDEALALTAQLLNLLPGCNAEDAEIIDTDDLNRELGESNPADADTLIAELADAGSVIELGGEWGSEIRTALCRIGGRSCGLVVAEGELQPVACTKAARFVRLCDCYSIPVVSVMNTCGIAVPEADAQAAAIVGAAQLLYSYAEATTAKVCVVVGDAIGQAYVAMGGKANADVTYAWPGATISALTPAAAVQVLYTKELSESTGEPLVSRKELEKKFAIEVAGAINAAEAGMVDDVIEPKETRKLVIAALEMLASKREANPPKKHGNLPL